MAPRSEPAGVQLEWPLVGRGGELEQVSRALARDDLSGVVLYGPGGVGKTRLASECLALGDQAGFATARAVATRASRSITLGALAPLLPDFGDRTFNLLGAARRRWPPGPAIDRCCCSSTTATCSTRSRRRCCCRSPPSGRCSCW